MKLESKIRNHPISAIIFLTFDKELYILSKRNIIGIFTLKDLYIHYLLKIHEK